MVKRSSLKASKPVKIKGHVIGSLVILQLITLIFAIKGDELSLGFGGADLSVCY